MHAHIQSIMEAVQSIGEVERAFWGGRSPAWSGMEAFERSARNKVYRHRLVLPTSSAHLAGLDARIMVQWTIEVHWIREPVLRHKFATKLLVGERQEVIVDELHLEPKSAAMFRARKREDVLPDDAPALVLWRRRYREAIARLNIECPSTFEQPQRPIETYSTTKFKPQGLPEFASELGSFILDELCGIPLSGGA
jgi:hypothetical protein